MYIDITITNYNWLASFKYVLYVLKIIWIFSSKKRFPNVPIFFGKDYFNLEVNLPSFFK